jgi:hypothetical protein
MMIGRSLVVTMMLAFLGALASASQAQQLVGQGEWRSLSGESLAGKWSVTLQRAGDRLDGSIGMTGSNLLSSAQVNGTIDGQHVMLGVMSDGAVLATFSGKLSGESVSGEWQSPVVKDEGVWYGILSTNPRGD